LIVPIYTNDIELLNDIQACINNVGGKATSEIRQTNWRRTQIDSNKQTDRKKTNGATDMSICKFCNEDIFWKQSKKTGKWYAVNDEGDNTSFHSKTCTRRW
jgi:hypothetical protein